MLDVKTARARGDRETAPARTESGPGEQGRGHKENGRAAGKATPAGTASPEDRTVHRLFLKTGASPGLVYDAVQEVRQLASHNIVAALQAHSAEVGAKLDLYMAKVDYYKAEMAAKLAAQKAELTAGLAAQKAEIGATNKKLDVAVSEIGTLRTLMTVTISLVGVLITLVGVLAGLGFYNQIIAPAAPTAVVAAPSESRATPEPATESAPVTPAAPPG